MGQPLERIARQYEIVAKIREGGMGEIYKVRHRLLDEVRVVKVLRSPYTDDARLSARLAQEARAAIRLRHPNIVQIFDFTLDDTGAGLIVMEFIRGADLKHLIARGQPPSLPLALEIGRQSLRALEFLHRHGFVHRDVSPDNLMLTEDVDGRPLVKLIDLGIAKHLDSDRQLTTRGMFLGKYRYASPEHFGDRGAEEVGARSDIYAFGLVFYELATGRYPLPGEGTAQLVAGHLYKQPLDFAETDPEGRIPEVLRRALYRSLAKNPGERFASALDFVAEIEALQRAHPLDPGCCEEARLLVASEGGEARWQPPGSTDERLNQDFEPRQETGVAERECRAREVAEIVARVDELLAGGALMEADRVLFQAAEIHGAADPLVAVRRRLDELRRRELVSAVRSLISQAESDAGSGAYGRALEIVAKARAVAPRDPDLEREIEAGERRFRSLMEEENVRREEAQRRVAELVRQAGIAFEAARFDEATHALRQASTLAPDDRWIRDRRLEAEAHQRRQAEAASCLRQAEEAEGRRDILKAQLLVNRAFELDPGSAIARERAIELGRRPVEPVLAPEAAAAADRIAELAGSGEILAAWRAVQAAVEELGDVEPFTTLRQKIAEELLDGGGTT